MFNIYVIYVIFIMIILLLFTLTERSLNLKSLIYIPTNFLVVLTLSAFVFLYKIREFNFVGLTEIVNKFDLFNFYSESLNQVDANFFWPFFFVFILITTLTLIYTISYNLNELKLFSVFIFFIFNAGFFIFFSNSLIVFFFAYEMLLIPSFILLYLFAKTRKSVEAAFLMFFWTQFGALCLIFNFQYLFLTTNSFLFSDLYLISFSKPELTFLFITLVAGFGVKFPIWPFYDWLPKAHVEASTNFSIFLSGVLVKFAFFGFLKYLLNLGIDIAPVWFYPLIVIGFLDASLKVYYQIDLKKLIAYSTVIEMHWLLFAVISGYSIFWIAGFAMMISHALISSNFFLLIDSITRRYKTRLVTEVSGIAISNPNLYFLTLIALVTFLGFPGSLLFFAEFLFFSVLLDLNMLLFAVVFFIAYFIVPSCFFKNWFVLIFNSYTNISRTAKTTLDLSKSEVLLVTTLTAILYWFGLSFQLFTL